MKGSILSGTVVLICMFEDNKFDIKNGVLKASESAFLSSVSHSSF